MAQRLWTPLSNDELAAQNLAQLYTMLGIINQQGSFNQQPIKQYNYARQNFLSGVHENNLMQQVAAQRAKNRSIRLQNAPINYNRGKQYPVKFQQSGGNTHNIRHLPAGNRLQAFLNAIAMQESGGSYNAVSPAGALGKYQVMPGNLASWGEQTVGHPVNAHHFLTHPGQQERVAGGILKQYFQKYGPAGAAAAWYSGDPSLKNSNAPQPYGGPTIHEYSQAIVRRMRNYLHHHG